MTAFSHCAKQILRQEFGHAVRPELDAVLTGLIEVENARGYNEYDAAIATVLAILSLCAEGRINTPVARRTMLEMSRRIVGVAHLGRRDPAEVRAALLALAGDKAADAALQRDLAAIFGFAADADRPGRVLH